MGWLYLYSSTCDQLFSARCSVGDDENYLLPSNRGLVRAQRGAVPSNETKSLPEPLNLNLSSVGLASYGILKRAPLLPQKSIKQV